jgi:hypothetical protein
MPPAGFEPAIPASNRPQTVRLLGWGLVTLVRLIETLQSGTCSKDQMGKYLCVSFPFRNSLKQGRVLPPFIFNIIVQNANEELYALYSTSDVIRTTK